MEARLKGETLIVDCIDKFPKMVDYVVPAGVRIADTSRVRLGAYVGEGTTVMHEGFINFNAGTVGVSMVEGRISSGVMVGEGSDIGGGTSIMGTLSGGGKMVVSIGENSLLGANAGLGFPLGNRCTIESGLYVTAGSKIKLLDQDGKEAGFAKARELANKDDLLFRRNSMTGQIECLVNKSAIELNSILHSNQIELGSVKLPFYSFEYFAKERNADCRAGSAFSAKAKKDWATSLGILLARLMIFFE
eukprot:TRINITY_DN28824_c0_g1_i1.p1 TRINITY_DN28824_c0_g1~~TRINITY_DN28824_c0_g1_i1.p1  ORF type:complete len:265 (+),score=22.59 TRINITY_DN28824_c0_g1_i1:57-797(+)